MKTTDGVSRACPKQNFYRIGQKVMLKRNKLSTKGEEWSGPHEISERVGETSYCLKRLKNMVDFAKLKLQEEG